MAIPKISNLRERVGGINLAVIDNNGQNCTCLASLVHNRNASTTVSCILLLQLINVNKQFEMSTPIPVNSAFLLFSRVILFFCDMCSLVKN